MTVSNHAATWTRPVRVITVARLEETSTRSRFPAAILLAVSNGPMPSASKRPRSPSGEPHPGSRNLEVVKDGRHRLPG